MDLSDLNKISSIFLVKLKFTSNEKFIATLKRLWNSGRSGAGGNPCIINGRQSGTRSYALRLDSGGISIILLSYRPLSSTTHKRRDAAAQPSPIWAKWIRVLLSGRTWPHYTNTRGGPFYVFFLIQNFYFYTTKIRTNNQI